MEPKIRSKFDKREEKTRAKLPLTVIPLNVAQSASGTSQNAEKTSAYRLSSARAVPLIEVRLYFGACGMRIGIVETIGFRCRNL
jgi:hypothetical protein